MIKGSLAIMGCLFLSPWKPLCEEPGLIEALTAGSR